MRPHLTLVVALALALLGGLAAAPAAAVEASCQGWPESGAAQAGSRGATADDILRLRDIGWPDEQQGAEPIFSLSPAGDKLVFQLRRANPAANGYCLTLMVLDLVKGGAPRRLDEGGELIRLVAGSGDFGRIETGVPLRIIPSWSPDGQALAYLRRDGGRTRAWVVGVAGGPARPVGRDSADVEALAWTSVGQPPGLVVSRRPGLEAAAQRRVRDGAQGYLYDNRMTPSLGAAPQLPSVETRYDWLDPVSGVERAASPAEQARLTPLAPGAIARFSIPYGEGAPTGSSDPAGRFARSGLAIALPGWSLRCVRLVCDQVIGAWNDPARDQVLFLRRQGWRGLETALYRWRRGARAPDPVLVTRDHLVGCDLASSGLICGQERANQPRRLVRIDVARGRMNVLFDPNPEFAGLELGAVTPLQWRNEEGYEAFGNLVLPPHLSADARPPLVIVQYEARGFLRGGTGDQFPIFPLAAQGFAVLALNNPRDVSYARELDRGDRVAVNQPNYQAWAGRRNTHASLLAGLDQVFKLDRVDRRRIGITGMSDGSGTVQWALLNSDLFSAAVVSNCCDDEFSMNAAGPLSAKRLRGYGFPDPSQGGSFFAPMSLARSAARMRTPYLLHISDSELLFALPTITALQGAGQPTEMFVYPDEFHMKWQPAHRAQIYARSLDWLSFWLRDVEDPAPDKVEQYRRWRALRAARQSAIAAAAAP